MTKTLTLDTALDLVGKHPYSGSVEDIVTLSSTISQSKKQFNKSVYKIFTEKSNIDPKIYSNLKKIGDRMDTLPIDVKQEVCRSFPPHYRTIYNLCSLKPEEIKTAVKKKTITKDMSYRESDYLVKQIRFPSKLVTENDKGRWSIKQEHLYSIFRSNDVYLGGERTYSFEEDLRRLCKTYGLSFRKPNQSISVSTIRHQERRERSLYWRQVLEKELSPVWFMEKDEKWKKLFNVKNIDELIDAPLRIFTGFIMRSDCGKKSFYTEYGKSYLAKVSMLMEITDNNANRYNYKKRINEKLDDKLELRIWFNEVSKHL